MTPSAPDLIVTAPNGVSWKRRPGGTSSGPEFLAAQATMTDSGGRIIREWNWWQVGQQQLEGDRVRAVISQWDHATPPPGGYLTGEQLQTHLNARQAERDSQRQAWSARYDQDLAMARLRLLRAQATDGFMRHVLASPASAAQQARAQQVLADSEREAAALAGQVGNPDAICDQHGDLPATRRERHLAEHMTSFRHPLLREWSSGQPRRFRQLLAMPAPQAAEMCSECQAPANWHTYALSLWLAGNARTGIERGEDSGTAARLVGAMPGVHRLPDPPPVGRHRRAARLRRRPVAGHADTGAPRHLRPRPARTAQTARPARRPATAAARPRSRSRPAPGPARQA
jgi:hypothetical protein